MTRITDSDNSNGASGSFCSRGDSNEHTGNDYVISVLRWKVLLAEFTRSLSLPIKRDGLGMK